MIAINQQAKRTTWLNRFTVSNDLTSLNDRDLRDVGLIRRQVGIDACKLFWMA